jgi:ferredoxin
LELIDPLFSAMKATDSSNRLSWCLAAHTCGKFFTTGCRRLFLRPVRFGEFSFRKNRCTTSTANHKEVAMKVHITSQCMGDRNCNQLCPEIFEYDEDQLLSTVKMDPIPEQFHDCVRQAADECGADAIIVEE